MTFAFHKGRYGVRLAQTPDDVEACQRLRHRCFFGGEGRDAEEYDESCVHIMVAGDHGLVATCRLKVFSDDLNLSYSAQRYDLKSISGVGTLIELGRFCIGSDVKNLDVLRLMWGGIARLVDENDAKMLFGCASFPGLSPARYGAALGLLARRFTAPDRLRIGQHATEVIPLSSFIDTQGDALEQMPSLLRSYLTMGGWVSDHAVLDRQMQTFHVFCGLEIAKIPPARANALRAIAR